VAHCHSFLRQTQSFGDFSVSQTTLIDTTSTVRRADFVSFCRRPLDGNRSEFKFIDHLEDLGPDIY